VRVVTLHVDVRSELLAWHTSLEKPFHEMPYMRATILRAERQDRGPLHGMAAKNGIEVFAARSNAKKSAYSILARSSIPEPLLQELSEDLCVGFSMSMHRSPPRDLGDARTHEMSSSGHHGGQIACEVA